MTSDVIDTPPQYVDTNMDTPPQYADRPSNTIPHFTITIAGTPETSVLVAQTLQDAGHSIAQVLCPFPKPVGRKKLLTASLLEQWAQANNISCVHVDKELLQDEEGLKSRLTPSEYLISADFGYLIPGWLLEWPSIAAINLHPSLLPRWRGATPVPMTILHDETQSGIAIIEMLPRFDTGPVITIEPFLIEDQDTTPDVLLRAFALGASRSLSLLPQRAMGAVQSIPQPKSSPTPYARKFTKDDGFIPRELLIEALSLSRQDSVQKTASEQTNEDLSKRVLSSSPPLLEEFGIPSTPRALHNMIRALFPWPGVWTLSNTGKRVRILRSAISTDGLKIHTAQVEGKSAQPFQLDWIESNEH